MEGEKYITLCCQAYALAKAKSTRMVKGKCVSSRASKVDVGAIATFTFSVAALI